MTIESCVTYPANSIFLMVRDPLISICKLTVGGEGADMTAAPDPQAAAIILHKFIFWTDNKLSLQHQKRYQDAAAAAEGEAKQPDNGLWIYKDYDELKIDLMNLFGRNKIIDNVQWLVSAGYLKRRTNPRYRWDKTLQYLVDIDLVQSRIDALPKFNSKLSSVPNQTIEKGKIKRAIPKKTTEKTKEEEKITTSAPAIANAGPVLNPDEKDVRYPFVEQRLSSVPFNGKTENPAQAENLEMGEADVTTPTPQPPSQAAPEMDKTPRDIVETPAKGKGKRKFTQEETRAMVAALGDAWGVPAIGDDYGLYAKKAQKLVENGVPVERFKAYCDRLKEKAGSYADRLKFAAITEEGRISDFHAWYAAKAEDEEKHKRLLESIPPDMLPRVVPVEQRATPEQIESALAKFRTPLFTSPESGEKIS